MVLAGHLGMHWEMKLQENLLEKNLDSDWEN